MAQHTPDQSAVTGRSTLTNEKRGWVDVIPILDIGSGTNPFIFRMPGALTVNHPSTGEGCLAGSDTLYLGYPSGAHIYQDARLGIDLPESSVAKVMMHYVIGESKHCVIREQDSYALFASIHRILVPGGKLYIRSVFRHCCGHGFDVVPFCSALLAGGFLLMDIEMIATKYAHTESFCDAIVREHTDFEGMTRDLSDDSCFLTAEKRPDC